MSSTAGKCKRDGSGVCFLLQANVRDTLWCVSSTAGKCKTKRDGSGVCLLLQANVREMVVVCVFYCRQM